MKHGIATQLLIVLIEEDCHEGYGPHLFDFITAHRFQELKVGDNLPTDWGETNFIG